MSFGKSTVLICAAVLAVTFAGNGMLFAAWGDKELETEKVAVNLLQGSCAWWIQSRNHGGVERLGRSEEGYARRRYHAF